MSYLLKEFSSPMIHRPVDDSLVLWINGRGSRNGGAVLADLSGRKNHGTIIGCEWKNTPIGHSVLQFDGIDDSVNIPSFNDFTKGITLEAWIKEDKTNFLSTNYQAESTTGNTTGDNWTTYRRGRLGIDTPGGTLIDFVILNSMFGTQTVAVYGYQTDTSVFAGTWEVRDNSTNELLGSGNLIKIAIGAPDKRMFTPFVFEGKGHDYHVIVYFSNTTDVFLDYIAYGKGGYEGIITKEGAIELIGFGNQYRIYINGGSKISVGSRKSNEWTHLVLTYDNINVKMYTNNVLLGTAAFSTPVAVNSNNFKLGEYFLSPSNNTFWGMIDNVRIYNIGLSPTEVSNAFHETRHFYGV